MEKINELVKKFIVETELVDMNDFTFINRLIEIYERHYKSFNVSEYKNKVSFKKNYQYSYDFLKSINPSYAEYLEMCKNSGVINVVDDPKNEKQAYSTRENGKNIIYIPLSNTIEDSYALTHEVTHDMSISEDTSLARHIFCEMLSFVAEELQYNYLNNLKVKDCHINPSIIMSAIKEKCDMIKFEQHLISTYLVKFNLSVMDIAELNNIFPIDFVVEMLKYLKANNDLSIDVEQRYVIGYLFSCYIIDRINNNEKNIQEFFELNEIINDYEIEDVIDYLDLELKDGEVFDLTESSYEKLEKSYVKRLRKI